METQKRITAIVITALLTVGMTLNFSGCSKDVTSLGPEMNEEFTKEVDNSNPYGFNILQSNAANSLAKEFVTEQQITPWGGTIQVGDEEHGISSLTFYPYSVTQNVDVRFWWESTGFLEGGSEFSPHGTQFFIPVRLQLSYKDTDLQGMNEDDLKIYYYNEDISVWEAQRTTVNKDNKVVVAWLKHFSRYAVGGE
jgi:hypothetical protein